MVFLDLHNASLGPDALLDPLLIETKAVVPFSPNTFNAPDWFLDSMPPPDLLGDKILDGELWAGRDNFQLMGIVRKKVPIPEEWLNIQYQVYDITNEEGSFVDRLKKLKSFI